MENFDNEQWRDIDGYEGVYQVSDFGRVRSLKYGKVRVLKPQKNKCGYLIVGLYKDGKRKGITVHRLVADAFIPNNDDAKNEINHINEDKEDNKVSNLEYCDRRYNVTYNDLNLRRKNGKRLKIAKLYNPDLSIADNLDIFRANGIECDEKTVRNLRKDLGLTNNKRDKLKELYRPDLTYRQNIEIFKENGIECCEKTLWKLRRDLGLITK